MSEQWLIAIIGGAIASTVGAVVGQLILSHFARSSSKKSTVPANPSSPVYFQPEVTVWRPAVIFVATLFWSPGGLFLASANWIRMGLRTKAFVHLFLAGVVFILVGSMLFLPEEEAQAFLVCLSFFSLFILPFYLMWETKKDIAKLKRRNYYVENANVFGGCLVSALGILMYLVIIIVTVAVLSLIGVPLPG